jgi:hypothetical protein
MKTLVRPRGAIEGGVRMASSRDADDALTALYAGHYRSLVRLAGLLDGQPRSTAATLTR